MLDSISVHGFKSLLELDELSLGRINVFIGANGSGKSALLEAIGVLGAAASGRVDDVALLRRGVRPGLPALYKSSFHGTKAPSEIRFSARSDDVSYEAGLFNPTDSPEPAWRYHTERLDQGATRILGRSHRTDDKLNPHAGFAALKLVEMPMGSPPEHLLDLLTGYRIYAPATAFLRGIASDPLQDVPLGLSGGRLAEAVEELFGQLGDDLEEFTSDLLELLGWASEITATPVGEALLSRAVPSPQTVLRFRDRFMAEGRNTLTAYDASEGALYLLATLVIALHPQSPSVAAIDNVDQALNPRLAKALMSRLCSWSARVAPGRQLLLTSHNPLLLDGLPLADDPSVRLFAVDRTNKGRTVVKRIELTPELLAKAKEGWTLSRLWVMGHLGAVPNV